MEPVAAALVLMVILFGVKQLVDSHVATLRGQLKKLELERDDLNARLLAESERPWLAKYPVDEEGGGGQVYYMDDKAMLKQERERDS